MESKNNDMINDINLFNKHFDLPGSNKFDIPSSDIIETRLNFMLEELCETAMGFGYSLEITNNGSKDEIKFVKNGFEINKHEILDGLVDLLYVVIGTAAFCGLTHREKLTPNYEHNSILELAWNRVHWANMQKERVKNASESKRNSSYDLKKPKGWKSPDLKDLL